MPDASHLFGSDLSISASGDLLTSDGSAFGQQRVLRRLLTNPLDDVWNPTYGAGLPRFVGQPTASAALTGLIRAQLKLESAVASDPAPTVDVDPRVDGTLLVDLRYVDSTSGTTTLLSVPVGEP